MNEPNIIYPSTWGYIPEWAENDIGGFRKKYNTLNAKCETLLTSSMYKGSAREGRCLIIADGFFEPHRRNNMPIPYYCYIPSDEFDDGRDIFVFAGIYNEQGDQSLSCSIITTEANDFFSEIHNVKKRMPLVLNNDLKGEWLSDELRKSHIEDLMKTGFTKKEFKAYSVSRNLYDRKRLTNEPNILDPVNYATLFD